MSTQNREDLRIQIYSIFVTDTLKSPKIDIVCWPSVAGLIGQNSE